MKGVLVFITLILCVSFLYAQKNDTTGLLKAIDRLGIAVSKADPRMLADLFTEDGDFTNVKDSTIHGRENIHNHHYNLWVKAGRPVNRTVNTLGIHFRFLRPEVAVIEVRWDNIHTAGPDGTTPPNRDGVWVSALIKENEQWYIAYARNLFLHDGTPGHEWIKPK